MLNYKPRNPLYLLILAYSSPRPIDPEHLPDYAGCKSWVPLDSSIPTGDSVPVLDDASFDARRRSILDRIARRREVKDRGLSED